MGLDWCYTDGLKKTKPQSCDWGFCLYWLIGGFLNYLEPNICCGIENKKREKSLLFVKILFLADVDASNPLQAYVKTGLLR